MDTAELEKRTHELLMHYDALDFDAIKGMAITDVQGVDEISKKWLRGSTAMDEYLGMVAGKLTDLHTDISDVHVTMRGDVGIVTCMLDQTYRFEGQPLAAKVPFTAIYVKEDSDWKVALIHGVSIPEEG